MTANSITNNLGHQVATLRQVAVGKYEVQRRSHRGDMVTLPATFSPQDVTAIREWAVKFNSIPTWTAWQKLPAYRRARSRK